MEQLADHLLGKPGDVRLIGKGKLDIHLGKLRLAIGPEILVPEALDDLEIAIDTGHHEQLLEQLGGLGQGEELAGMGTARHQVVACTLGRGAGEHRGLHLKEAALGEEVAQGNGDIGAEPQVLHHLLAAQVQIAVAQTHILANLNMVIELEGRRFRGVEDNNLAAVDLDLPRVHVRVDGTGAARTDDPFDLKNILAAHSVGDLEELATVVVEDHLNDALAVAKIDKDHAAVVAAPVHPATQGDLLIDRR